MAGTSWNIGIPFIGSVINSFTQPQSDPQAFVKQEAQAWNNPMDQFKPGSDFWAEYDKIPDSGKNLYQTMAFMGPLSLMSERAADRNEAAANRLLAQQFQNQTQGANFTAALKMNLGALELAGQALNRPSLIATPYQRMPRVDAIQGPMG